MKGYTQEQFDKQYQSKGNGKVVAAILNKDWNISGVAILYGNGYVCQTWKEPHDTERFVHNSDIEFDIDL